MRLHQRPSSLLSSSSWAVICFLLACCAPSSFCRAETTIQGRLQYPDKSPFNITTQVTLNHGEFSTYCQLANGCSFEFPNVPGGIHQLDVLSTTHHFAQVKIQVSEGEAPKCLEYGFPGANKQVVEHPLQLKAYATFEYFEQRRGFSIFMILKNPMVLMMAFSVGLMFLMPKMMEGLEPEERAKMKEQMEMQQDPTKMLNQFWEGISGQEPEAPPKLSSAAAAQQKKRK